MAMALGLIGVRRPVSLPEHEEAATLAAAACIIIAAIVEAGYAMEAAMADLDEDANSQDLVSQSSSTSDSESSS